MPKKPLSRQPHSAAPHGQPPNAAVDAQQRLQKVLAAAGVGSRRKCEELILAGRVEVDRQVVTNLGAKADPARQEVRLDGVPLARPRLVHFLVHKPVGVVSTNYDQAGRPRVVDLLPPARRAALLCRPVGHVERRVDAADQRRRTGTALDASPLRRGKDLSGRSRRRHAAPPTSKRLRKGSTWPKALLASTESRCIAGTRRARCSRSY